MNLDITRRQETRLVELYTRWLTKEGLPLDRSADDLHCELLEHFVELGHIVEVRHRMTGGSSKRMRMHWYHLGYQIAWLERFMWVWARWEKNEEDAMWALKRAGLAS